MKVALGTNTLQVNHRHGGAQALSWKQHALSERWQRRIGENKDGTRALAVWRASVPETALAA